MVLEADRDPVLLGSSLALRKELLRRSGDWSGGEPGHFAVKCPGLSGALRKRTPFPSHLQEPQEPSCT